MILDDDPRDEEQIEPDSSDDPGPIQTTAVGESTNPWRDTPSEDDD